MIDSHCHFDDPLFDGDREEVFRRATLAGVKSIISPAVTAGTWTRLKTVAKPFPGIFPCYGLHPMFIGEHLERDVDELVHWIEREKPVAVGEIGLDFYQDKTSADKQRWFFCQQLDIAAQTNLPVIIHARKAVEEVIQTVRQYDIQSGVLHSYSGSAEQASQLQDRDFYFGFGGPITWPNSKKLHRVVETIPLEKILLETDAPDQPSQSHRGERNEPAYLQEIATAVSKIKNIDIQKVIDTTSTNASRLFNIYTA